MKLAFLVRLSMFAAFLLPAGAPATASPIFSGQVFGNSYLPVGPDQNSGTSQTEQTQTPLQNQLAIWLTGDFEFSPSVSSHATLTANGVSPGAARSAEGFHGDLREAFVESFKRGIGLKVGRQIISWGKSDGFNPTDYFSAFDYTIFNPDQEVQRFGTDALVFSYSPKQGRSKFNLTAVYVAIPPHTKLLQFEAKDSSGFRNTGDERQKSPLNTPEGALKISYTGRGWDFSISSFIGQTHTPSFRPVSFTVSPQPLLTVEQYYQPVWTNGADFSVSWGDWVLRGEGAYTYVRETDPSEDPLILPDHFDGVLGAERALGDSIRVGLQTIVRYSPQWASAESATSNGVFSAVANRQLARANQLIQGTQSSAEFGESLRFEFTDVASGIDFQLFFLHYERRQDFLFRPVLTYHLTDALKIYGGLNDFGGPSESPFGAYSVYDALFAGATFVF